MWRSGLKIVGSHTCSSRQVSSIRAIFKFQNCKDFNEAYKRAREARNVFDCQHEDNAVKKYSPIRNIAEKVHCPWYPAASCAMYKCDTEYHILSGFQEGIRWVITRREAVLLDLYRKRRTCSSSGQFPDLLEYIAFRKCRLLFDYIAYSSSLLTHKLIEKLRRGVIRK